MSLLDFRTRFRRTHDRLSVAGKLSLAAGAAVLLCFMVVGALLSWRTQQALSDEALDTLAAEAAMTVSMLTTFERQLADEGARMSAALGGYFPESWALDADDGAGLTMLRAGGKVIAAGNAELERFSARTGQFATVFARRGDDFIRVATTVADAKGRRATGTALDPASPARAALLDGKPFAGKLEILGRQIYAHYRPLRDNGGRTIGALFVGVDFSEALQAVKTRIKAVKVGKTGYIYALDADPRSAGTLTIHPAKEGQNIWGARDAAGNEFIREMVTRKQGVIHYPWMNQELKDRSARMKVVAYDHFPAWNWVIGVGSYSDEFAGAAVQVRNFIIVASLCAAAVLAWLLVVLSRRLVSVPAERAVQVARNIAQGDLDTPIEIGARDELGRLLESMDVMRERVRAFVRLQETLARQHNDAGIVSARLDEAAFPGAFGQMARGVNTLLDGHVDLQRQTMEIMEAFAAGRFEQEIAPQPGEKARVNDVTERVRETLRAFKQRAEFDERVRKALDCVAANVRIADADGRLIYINTAMRDTLIATESEIAKKVPGFRVATAVGGSVGVFYDNPAEGLARLKALRGTARSRMTIGGRIYDVVTTPIMDESGQVAGTVGQWQDLTEQLRAEEEVDRVVQAAARGDLSQGIALEGKSGFIRQVGAGINQLTASTRDGVEEVARVLSAIARGDLTLQINKEFHGVFAALKDDVNGTCRELRDTLQRIRASSQSVDTAAREIAKGNSDLSTRTAQQASSIESTAANMGRFTEVVQASADSARQANDLALSASDVAARGGKVVEQVVSTMASIKESSKRIQEIISVIDGIAFQTNILALNAAVEAARAGEQGRGFAVVATEVRNLAQRSAAAAREIKSLISASVERVDAGADLVDRAGRTMDDIVGAVRQVTAIMGTIAGSSEQQRARIGEVHEAMSSMDDMTQQNAALVEQAAAAAQSLESEAGELLQAVDRFIVTRDDDAVAAALRTAA